MSDDASIPLPNQIACVAREIALRERCYPLWVKRDSMKLQQAHYELAAMRAVLETLKGLDNEQPGS